MAEEYRQGKEERGGGDQTLVGIAARLAGAAAKLRFKSPVFAVYNPLQYAWYIHRSYLERWGQGKKEVLLLGMNPGPWGMAQSGVPFGEVSYVRDWLDLEGEVLRPAREHPKRPVSGLACQRSEVSGRRLWGWAAEQFRTPERFFERFFVGNYCPLMFLEESGCNRTPDRLPAKERQRLVEICDRALRQQVAVQEPERVIGVGRYAAAQAERALQGSGVAVGRVLHPSPANPTANRGWAERIETELAEMGVRI